MSSNGPRRRPEGPRWRSRPWPPSAWPPRWTGRAGQLDQIVDALRAARRSETETTRAITDELEQLRRQRSSAERRLAELRERAGRLELDEAEARIRLETLVESHPAGSRLRARRRPAGRRCPQLPPGTSPTSRARELERELRLLGPINPLALEEYTALAERSRFLEAQLDDIRAGRRELTKVIRAIDAEIVEVFRAAYADVVGELRAPLLPPCSQAVRGGYD